MYMLDELDEYMLLMDRPECRNLPTKEAKELGYRMKDGDSEATDLLFFSVMRWIFNIAKRFSFGHDIPLSEILAEANLAAIRALPKWNPDKNKLTTFITACVQNHLFKYMKEGHSTVRVPAYTTKMAFEFVEEFGGILPDKKVLKKFKSKVSKSKKVSRPRGRDLISAYGLLMRNESHDIDYLPVNSDLNIDDDNEISIESFREIVNEREWQFLIRYFGLYEFKNQQMFLGSIGKEFRISKERVRQVISNALDKIRLNFPNEFNIGKCKKCQKPFLIKQKKQTYCDLHIRQQSKKKKELVA